MFNKTYQARATRQGLGKMLAEGLLKPCPPGESDAFYRPAERPQPGTAAKRRKNTRHDPAEPVLQLELFGDEESAEMFERLFPL